MNAQPDMNQPWTAERLLELGRSYHAAAVFTAAADLDLFSAVGDSKPTAAELADRLGCDLRGLTILLDALAALRLLDKQADRYALPEGTAALLTSVGAATVLPMAQHQGSCLRRWAQLSSVVKTGQPASCIPGVRGHRGDHQAFIGAMHSISAPVADQVIRGVQPLEFKQLLDIGGASGTWTIAFLRACPTATATLFDLPPVIPLAEERMMETGLRARVNLVAGDFLKDPLPSGADLAWVSAIVHQNSRSQNRALFARVFQALAPLGRIVIRDILMDETHTQPVAGALFAVNMLVATEGGATYTVAELEEDLGHAGFTNTVVLCQDQGMNALLAATKPATA